MSYSEFFVPEDQTSDIFLTGNPLGRLSPGSKKYSSTLWGLHRPGCRRLKNCVRFVFTTSVICHRLTGLSMQSVNERRAEAKQRRYLYRFVAVSRFWHRDAVACIHTTVTRYMVPLGLI